MSTNFQWRKAFLTPPPIPRRSRSSPKSIRPRRSRQATRPQIRPQPQRTPHRPLPRQLQRPRRMEAKLRRFRFSRTRPFSLRRHQLQQPQHRSYQSRHPPVPPSYPYPIPQPTPSTHRPSSPRLQSRLRQPRPRRRLSVNQRRMSRSQRRKFRRACNRNWRS